MDFSSGKRGNLIQFIIDHDRVSVADAVNILKRYAHIVDDESGGRTTRLEATKIAKKYRDKTRKPQKTIAKPLPANCMSQYEFRRDKLQLWVDEGISWETLIKYDVRYDAFDDRIVYPIKDYDGNIISICGRTCDPDYKAKKLRKYTYKQQIGTLDTIYGFSDNKHSIIGKREVIIFEGAKSCMKAHEWGVENTAALLTSHLSLNQLRFLIKLCGFNNVVVVFALDSDIDIKRESKKRFNPKRYSEIQPISLDQTIEEYGDKSVAYTIKDRAVDVESEAINNVICKSIDLGVGDEANKSFIAGATARIQTAKNALATIEAKAAEYIDTYRRMVEDAEMDIAKYRKLVRELEAKVEGCKQMIASFNADIDMAKNDVREAVETLIGKQHF